MYATSFVPDDMQAPLHHAYIIPKNFVHVPYLEQTL